MTTRLRAPSLRVAIVHYHLQPGGVTRVIRHAIDALDQHGVRVVVLTGEPPFGEPWRSSEFRTVRGLGYASSSEAPDPRQLADDLHTSAEGALDAQPDLWHFHNHSLGKNPALALAIDRLAEAGNRLLLQIHDFVEDARPGNYSTLRKGLGSAGGRDLGIYLYPQASHIHYGVLNRRDRDFFARAGVLQSQLHLLSNPVDLNKESSRTELHQAYAP